MARSILPRQVSKEFPSVAAWAIGLALLWAPASPAQRVTHPPSASAAGGSRSTAQRGAAPAAPQTAAPGVSRGVAPHPRGDASAGSRGFQGLRGPAVGIATFRMGLQPIPGLRQPFFHGRFVRLVPFGFTSFLWGCAPQWGWTNGCSQLPVFPPNPGTGFENYVMVQNSGNPGYLYLPEGHDLVWLYLKDGSAYAVTDYWFVNGEVHFYSVEGGMLSGEQVIDSNELDAQKTSEVNTTRGFRVVRRDAPWQKDLKDHPSDTPPPLGPKEV